MAMDIFTFASFGHSFFLDRGAIVNGYDRATWVERYSDDSEFTIEGRADTDLREQMPIGSLVSHTGTDEIMIVEDHQLSSSDGIATVSITGRAYETILENRIINSNRNWSSTVFPQSQFTITTAYACLQARYMISQHIDPENLLDDNDALPLTNVCLDTQHINATYGPPLWEPEDDTFDRVPVYDAVKTSLAVDNLGMKTRRYRPGVNLEDNLDIPTRYNQNWLTIYIYAGFDRRKSVQFSHRAGDVKEADYLWSNRPKKTSCLAYSRYFAAMIHGPETGYGRRVMTLDCTDLDEQYDSIPGAGPERTQIERALRNRARAALAKKNLVALASVRVDDSDNTYRFREDYNLGDYVSVYGDYNATTELQVTEHVEIQDVSGYTAYPTLSEITGGYYVPTGRY